MTQTAEPKVQRPVVGLLLAAGISAAAGYGVLIVSARVLDPATNARFLVFWGALFGLYSVLTGLTTETTRAVFASSTSSSLGTRVAPVTASAGGVVLAAVAVIGVVVARPLFGADWLGLLGDLALGVVLYTVHATLIGAAAGKRAWTPYGLLIALESSARLALCLGVALIGWRLGGLAVATAAASGTTLVVALTSRRLRPLLAARADVSATGLARRLAVACTASGVSGLLVVGYPVLVRLTSTDGVFAGAAPLLLAVSLSRAPLLVPLMAYQNVVVTQVVAKGARALTPAAGVIAVVAAPGAVLAWPLGPWALHIVAPTYDVAGPVFSVLVLGAGVIALLTLTGAATLALDHHDVFLAGWLTATAVAVLLLVTPADLTTRVLLSLTIGPLTGALVHAVFGLLRSSRRQT